MFLLFSFVVVSVPSTVAPIAETFDAVNKTPATLPVLVAQAGVDATSPATTDEK
ncbi:MAG: hypothetical protein J07HX64_00489 [halophilic archaeon J07HX64]|nr:MAG: hypothetical protein J07HX64_00489 [halophilic archaeon J07HX64]